MADPNSAPEIKGLDSKEDKKIGQILLERGLLNSQQLAEAMATQQKLNAEGSRKFKLGEVLVYLKIITLAQLHESLREQRVKSAIHRQDMLAVKEREENEKAEMEKLRSSFSTKKPGQNHSKKPKDDGAFGINSLIKIFKKDK